MSLYQVTALFDKTRNEDYQHTCDLVIANSREEAIGKVVEAFKEYTLLSIEGGIVSDDFLKRAGYEKICLTALEAKD